MLEANLGARPEISVTFFKKDEKKQGGAYALKTGVVRRIDGYERRLLFEDGSSIPLADILLLEGDVFSEDDRES